MKKVLEYLKGKKSYILGIVVAVLGVLESQGVFSIPDYLWPILAAVGLGTLRAGISDISKQVKK